MARMATIVIFNYLHSLYAPYEQSCIIIASTTLSLPPDFQTHSQVTVKYVLFLGLQLSYGVVKVVLKDDKRIINKMLVHPRQEDIFTYTSSVVWSHKGSLIHDRMVFCAMIYMFRKYDSRTIEKRLLKQGTCTLTFLPHLAQKANQTVTCDMTVKKGYICPQCALFPNSVWPTCGL